MPLDAAALLACGVITGLGAVINTAQVPAGAEVVVIGTGGVGLNSVQGAALRGARTIIAVDLSDSKLAAARRFGATHALNPARDDLPAAVRALTGGRGADYVFVTVGAKAAIEQALRAARPRRGGRGRRHAGRRRDDRLRSQQPRRATASACSARRWAPPGSGIDVPMLVDLYRQGRLKLDELISGRYPLEEINAAIASRDSAARRCATSSCSDGAP